MVETIIKKIITALTILFMSFTLGCCIRYLYLNKTIIPYYKKNTEAILAKQVQVVNDFLDKNEQQIDDLSHDKIILEGMKQLIANPHNTNIIQKLSSHITVQQEQILFKNLFLISIDGDILFSTSPQANGINLISDEYSRSALSESFQRSLMTLSTDFSDFSRSPILEKRAFYITKPLLKDKKLIGVIAYQIEEKKLLESTQDYTHLGKTGEIVLGIAKDKYTFFVLPTRHDPYRALKEKRIIETQKTIPLQLAITAIPLQLAALGGYSTGIGHDYRDKKVISSWDFIPRVKWGIVAKIDYDEAFEPLKKIYNYFLISLIITILLLLLSTFIQGTFSYKLTQMAQQSYLATYIPKNIKHPLIIPLSILCYLSFTSLYNFKNTATSAIENSKKVAIKTVNEAIDTIDTQLQKIEDLAYFIAQDLQTARLISEDIRKRIKRDLLENQTIESITIAFAPYAHSKDTKLYAPSIKKQEQHIEEKMINEQYDYTDEKQYGSKTDWYTKAITSKKAQWLNPQKTDSPHELIATYSFPFYYQESTIPSGVISIKYNLNPIITAAQDTGIGKTGYSFIITKDGTFLYHPIQQLVTNKKTLLQFAQEDGNEELASIALEIKKKKPLITQFINKTTQMPMWIYSHPINTNGWTIGTIFASSEIGLPSDKIQKYLLQIIAYMTLTLLLALALFYTISTIEAFASYLTASNGILTCSILCLWYIIGTTHNIPNDTSTHITSQSGLNTFIIKQIDNARQLSKTAPLAIPTGIILYSLEQTNPTHISFSAYIWHKYHKTLHKDIQQSIYIPQATYFRTSNEIKIIDGDWEIVGVNVIATVYHEHSYIKYPFDIRQIRIPLEHTDLTKNILLVPDISSYSDLNPEKTPGIEKTFSPSAFSIQETFFDLTPVQQTVTLGTKQQIEKGMRYQLAFNAVMSSDLLNPFILFFLPLLVILISIFSILILEKKTTDPYTIIGPYTGLLFGLVLLHRSLHETAPSEQTLYMEYSFFFTYIIIIILVIHTILAQYYFNWDFYEKKLTLLFKALFWPVQLISWIITTFIMFY